MGNTGGKSSTEDEDEIQMLLPKPSRSAKGRKRKRGGGLEDIDEMQPSGSKVFKLDTAKYVYEKLFVNGEESDVIICAMGHQWNLHKFYLKQAKYFEVLLSGVWKDSTDSVFQLDIPDERITVDGLHVVLGSLYDNEMTFSESQLDSIVAAASLLQLEGVLARAHEEMLRTLSDDNVLRFLECAHRYGLAEVRNAAFERIKWSFWRLARNVDFLANLPEEAMSRLMASPELLAVEGEIDLYRTLKLWIYLQTVPEAAANLKTETASTACSSFYASVKASWTESGRSSPASSRSPSPPSATSTVSVATSTLSATVPLSTPYSLFMRYSHLFAGLRLHSLINCSQAIALLYKDALIPPSVVRAAIVDQYTVMLATDEETASTKDEVTDEAFLLASTRFGRQMEAYPKCWRWTGFNNGLDLLLNFNKGILSMKRNVRSQAAIYSLNVKKDLQINYRVILSNKDGVCLFDSLRKSVTLQPDSSVIVARLAPESLPPPPISVHLFLLFGAVPQPAFIHIQPWLAEQSAKLRRMEEEDAL